jgi:hypothetical protein
MRGVSKGFDPTSSEIGFQKPIISVDTRKIVTAGLNSIGRRNKVKGKLDLNSFQEDSQI